MDTVDEVFGIIGPIPPTTASLRCCSRAPTTVSFLEIKMIDLIDSAPMKSAAETSEREETPSAEVEAADTALETGSESASGSLESAVSNARRDGAPPIDPSPSSPPSLPPFIGSAGKPHLFHCCAWGTNIRERPLHNSGVVSSALCVWEYFRNRSVHSRYRKN